MLKVLEIINGVHKCKQDWRRIFEFYVGELNHRCVQFDSLQPVSEMNLKPPLIFMVLMNPVWESYQIEALSIAVVIIGAELPTIFERAYSLLRSIGLISNISCQTSGYF